MEINVTFRNMDPTDALRQHAEKKVSRLEKFTKHTEGIDIILKVEQHKNHVAEIVFLSDGQRYTSTSSTHDMYTAIDDAVHKLETQVRKHKEKVKAHKSE